MDTSKEYIKMCEKAVELQMNWKPKEGDWFKAGDNIRCLCCEWFCAKFDYPEIRFAMTTDIKPFFDPKSLEIKFGDGKYVFKSYMFPVWLPRQDKLQEMVKGETYKIQGYSKEINTNNWIHPLQVKFHKWCYEFNDNLLHQPMEKATSYEQLWLAFVMKEKYNKIWNGKDWIKE